MNAAGFAWGVDKSPRQDWERDQLDLPVGIELMEV